MKLIFPLILFVMLSIFSYLDTNIESTGETEYYSTVEHCVLSDEDGYFTFPIGSSPHGIEGRIYFRGSEQDCELWIKSHESSVHVP
jgi:hypothetical protein